MSLIIKKNKYGRGVYSDSFIKYGDIIEVCELILVSNDEINDNHKLAYYSFVWNDNLCAIPLGNGNLYNHSFDANAHYIRNFKTNKLKFVAIKDIQALKEITINYNGIINSKDKVEFYEKGR